MSSTDGAHLPVMLVEVLAGLSIDPDGFYVDCTFGRGGHSRGILERLGPKGRLLALDKDQAAVCSEEARKLAQDARFRIEHGSYAELQDRLERHHAVGKVWGIVMDLGVSSPQLDEAERGFSFMRDGMLDMRMDVSRGVTAAEWLSSVAEGELARILRVYGEERYARRIARAIVEAREQGPIVTTRQLAELIERAVPSREKNKHPATRSFQAIRIAVNAELEQLEEALPQAVEALKPGGRLAVISFHSLEDRIVKRFMRDEERGRTSPPNLPLVVERAPRLKRIGKAQVPSEAEIGANPRARSAVLRVAERVAA
jgi:16S rRNA (cytosine1402-N4)-methyltransferase